MTKQCNWGRDVFLAEVPDGTAFISIIHIYAGEDPIVFHRGDGEIISACGTPPPSWQFAFADPLNPTEQEAGGWVERQRGRGNFREYSMSGSSLNMYGDYYLNTAIESLHSRYRSEGFKNPERVVQLIKK